MQSVWWVFIRDYHYVEGYSPESRIWGKSQLALPMLWQRMLLSSSLPDSVHPRPAGSGQGVTAPCLPSGHGLDTVGLNKQGMHLNCGADVLCGVSHCSRTEGGDVLVCSAVLLPKEARVWEMGKMVEKWDTPSRLTLFTSTLTPHWSPHLACVWQPALRPWHQLWDPPSARCSPCSSTGHSACWHRIWVVYKKRTGDSIQNSIPGHSFTDWDWNRAFWDWSVILIPYVYF